LTLLFGPPTNGSEEEIVKCIINVNEDESEQADDETDEIVFKVPFISEVYFSVASGAYVCFGKQRYQYARNNNGIKKYR